MASRVTSEKWISTSDEEERKVSATEGRLILHNVRPLFQPVWNTNTNIISVFGRARQGKSFLMNCLSGEQSLFKVSNYKESCTQGIDISSKFMGLTDFSRVDGGRAVAAPRSEIKVGFVDAEGQGDKDIAYDANLICPILLASKCVIFNWKGDLQKDHILSTLGIMTRAAKNVSAEGESAGGAAKKFGHLHIVFRDWQSVGSDEASVTDILFSAEKGKDAQTRNQIREEVRDAFASIRVWLFEAPTDSVQALRQVLTIDVTTPRFRQQVRDFRAVLAQQLSEPVLFAQRPLTGKTICSMMTDVVQTLNRGEVILPASTYLTMMKEEVTQLTHSFEEEVKEVVTKAMHSVDKDRRHVIEVELPDKKKHSLSLYLNCSDALQVFRSLADVALQSALKQIHDVIGLPPSTTASASTSVTPYELLYRESGDRLRRQVEEAQKSFELHYLHHLQHYLRHTRQRLEAEMEATATSLRRSPPSFSTSKECRDFLEVVLVERHVSEVNPSQYYTSATSGASASVKQEVDDVIALLRRFSQPLLQQCLTSCEETLKKRKDTMDAIYANIRQTMEAHIPVMLQRLTSQHKKGFSTSVLCHALDEEYQRLDAQLRHLLATSVTPPASTTVVEEYSNVFYEHCASLREACQKEYDALKEKYLYNQFTASEEVLNEELQQLAQHWETQCELFLAELKNDAASVAHRQLMGADEARHVFDDLVTKIWKQAIADVIGWLSDSIPSEQLSNEAFLRQTSFGHKLHAFLSDNVTPFFEGFVSVLKQIEAQRVAAVEDLQNKQKEREEEEREVEQEEEEADDFHDNFTVPMDEDDRDLDEEDEEEEGDDKDNDIRATQRALSKAKKASRVTLEEQRRRARDFAERVLGVSFTASKGKKKAAAAPAKKGGATTSNSSSRKSLLQQREAARDFAVRNFGAAILNESDDDEEEQQENVRRNSTSAKKRAHDEVNTGKTHVTPVKASTTTTTTTTPPTAKTGSGKKAAVTSENPIAAARRAAEEERLAREKEAIEKATKRIQEQQKKKQGKTGKK